MKRRLGLKVRFIGVIVLLLTSIFAVITIIVIHNNTNSLRRQLQTSSLAFAALATKPIGDTYLTYADSGTIQITQQIVNFTALDKTVTNVSVVAVDGTSKYSLHKDGTTISKSDAATFTPIYAYAASHAIRRIIYPFIDDTGDHQYAVVYDISSQDVDNAVRSLTMSILTYSVVGLLISAAVTYLLINRLFLIPIKKLRDRAIIISAGQYSEQIVLDRNDEIGDLALSVSQMADSLKSDITKLKEVDQIKSEFMLIASHYLRTPLTIIDGYLELAKAQTLSDDLRSMLSKIETNSRRLGVFAEDLLVISGIEAGQKTMMQPLTMQDLLNPLTERFQVLAKEKSITFTVTMTDPTVRLEGSKAHLQSAISSLLDNALKFTPKDGSVTLAANKQADTVQLTIADNGAGIAAAELDKLFTKFHRGTSTLEYNYEGSGIGLYLTKLIINEHGGTISVASEPGKGSTFTLTLPRLVS
jgi:signal transduction histidine kinase